MTSGLDTFPAIIVMVTSTLGCGVIFLPKAFKDIGGYYGPALLCTMGCVSLLTLFAINFASYKHLKQRSKSEKYEVPQENGEKESGKKGEEEMTYYSVAKTHSTILALAIDISIIIQSLGCCVTYVLSLQQWTYMLFGFKKYEWIPKILFVAVLFVLAAQKSLSSLRYVSYLSVISVVYLMFMLMFYAVYYKADMVDFAVSSGAVKGQKSGLHDSLASCIFALGCHQNIVGVFRELKQKTLGNINRVALSSIIICSLIYLTIGQCGYIVGGDYILKDILSLFIDSAFSHYKFIKEQTFDKYLILPRIATCGFLIVMLCAFPLQQHPARDSALNIVKMFCNLKDASEQKLYYYKVIITAIACTLIGTVSCFINGASTVVGFIGATATNGIMIIFPTILYALTVRKFNYKTVASLTMTALGVILSIYLLVMQIRTLTQSKGSAPASAAPLSIK
ncbi:hypothetical protein EDEG_03276 [Edhazardia aedis USNM 41457]|uniref:Amino acid transporter transmembrane domain-containing protein n=1 Tax=Edhazardia aedis (strain USNM 41457) TaxID=1003232 RepID=J8ZRH1_EDHAE|nr:hypothetical protein EDEG_03276 [Edhazardia aedis USNM 41457]|eukprot:EJW02293.1 hypothetical protein EDEG_03276 [Edhazardia aedis USNM 41457]